MKGKLWEFIVGGDDGDGVSKTTEMWWWLRRKSECNRNVMVAVVEGKQ